MRGPVGGAKLRGMPWNSDLRSDVEEQLAWEPDIDANAIAVLVVDGHVTLRGTVGSLEEKRTAERIAAQVFGVVAIEDRLEVHASILRSARTRSSEPRSCKR
jgi:osmotically-inducible protein OsmY